MITTCFLKNEIDFNAVDKKPVFVLFLMLCSTTKLHLKLLSKLSLCLREKAFISLAPHKDLWVNSGTGSFPKPCSKTSVNVSAVR